ncbi:hypothetical protein E0494_05365 [Marinilabiliaceae bacterium JC040]|nr:hypothetical protein [Marinilabiliaceae bacterium JC040]
MKKIIVLLVLILCVGYAKAQYVDNGQDPFSISWKQVDNKYFKLIFPEGENESAQRFANILYSLFDKKYSSLNHKPSKIPIVLHSRGGRSNGMVVWAPKRMELFSIASTSKDYVDFYQHLAVHEFRHVVQTDKINQGFTRFLYYLFGEQVVGGVLGLYVPMWFLEGDAVAFETGNTLGGRGRDPQFLQELKAQILDKGTYSYSKAVLGSYKDYIPNRYPLGYYMITNSRKNYGTKIWEQTLDEVGRKPFNPFCFRSGINKIISPKRDSVCRKVFKEYNYQGNIDSIIKATKYNDAKLTLYYDNMRELKMRWEKENKESKIDKIKIINKKKDSYTSYKHPVIIDDTSYIALKEGINLNTAIVKITPKKEEILKYTGSYVNRLSYANGKLVWSEYIPHLRWENGGKMVLNVYNIYTKRHKRIKYKNNVFSPSINDKGEILLVAENTNQQTSIIRYVDDAFFILKSFNNKEIYIDPTWIDNNRIAYIAQDSKGRRIELFNISNSTSIRYTESKYTGISNLYYNGGNLYFTSSVSGKDELYALNIKKETINKLTSSKYGSRHIAAKDNKILYSTYTADGYSLVTKDMKDVKKDSRFYKEQYKYPLAETINKQELLKDKEYKSRDNFKVESYSKILHGLNIHSWAPVYTNSFSRDINKIATVGVSVSSQNALSTLFLSGGYKLDNRYVNGSFAGNISYRGFWPIFDFDVEYGKRKYYRNSRTNLKTETDVIPGQIVINGEYKHLELTSTMKIPFNISRANYTTKIIPYIKNELIFDSQIDINSAIFTKESRPSETTIEFDLKNHINIPKEYNDFQTYGLDFYNLRHLSHRDINSRWGQLIHLGYIHSLNVKKENLWGIFSSVKLYFPGFFKNDGFSLYDRYEKFSKYNFISNSEESSEINILSQYKSKNHFKIDYVTPLLYPDWNILNMIYIKRFYTKMFYSQINLISLSESKNQYSSYGNDLIMNFHILNFKLPLQLGYRFGYENYTGNIFSKILFKVSFNI